MRRIGVMGPQGSGKSTQSKLIAEKLGFCLIDTGALIRARAGADDTTALDIQQAMKAGNLVDNQIPAGLLRERLTDTECLKGAVIDGYPRSIEQLSLFDPIYDKVFYLDISDQVAIDRLMQRKRLDDTPEAIKNRLNIFHQKTNLVLDHFDNLGILVKVNGELDPEVVFSVIEQNL